MSKTRYLAEAIQELATHGRLSDESVERLAAIVEDKNLDELEEEMMRNASDLINENNDDDDDDDDDDNNDVKAEPKAQPAKQARKQVKR